MFLAYASQVTRIPQYADMARAGLKSLLATNGGPVWIPNGSCGSLDGIGGTVYSLTHVSALLEDEPLLDVVETCLREAEGLVSPNMEVDVFGGAAGCVLAALASHAFTGSDTALRVARLYGDVVRNALMGQGWSSDAEIARLIAGGFAHGPLGLLYALHQLGRKLGGSYAEAAAMVVDDLCGIPTERLEIMLSDLPASWCRGSSGCITALMRILPYPLGSWLSVHALVTARSEKELVASDCLCHGEMGNIEPLLEARRWFSGERWTEAVSIQGSQLLQRAATNGWTCGGRAENPGLMVGLGGIGLQLLRMDRPDQVPSVLLLDPPPGVEEIP